MRRNAHMCDLTGCCHNHAVVLDDRKSRAVAVEAVRRAHQRRIEELEVHLQAVTEELAHKSIEHTDYRAEVGATSIHACWRRGNAVRHTIDTRRFGCSLRLAPSLQRCTTQYVRSQTSWNACAMNWSKLVSRSQYKRAPKKHWRRKEPSLGSFESNYLRLVTK